MAAGSAKPPIKVASSQVQESPQVLVTSKGTLLLTHIGGIKIDQSGQKYPLVEIARKPKHAKKFSIVKLPGKGSTVDPFLYQPSKGVLEVLATNNGPLTLAGWTSTNDGKSWKSLNASAVNDPTFKANGVYVNSELMTAGPDGALQYAGSNGAAGPVIQISPDLKHVTTIATNSTASNLDTIGKTAHGIVFQVGTGVDPSAAVYSYEVDHSGANKIKSGSVSFPAAKCTQGTNGNFAAAVGKSNAVVVHNACGHSWSRSISATGKVGKLVNIGAGGFESPTVDVVADSHGHYTATFSNAGGDLNIARSNNGSKWKKGNGALAVNTLNAFGVTGMISRGSATWFGYGIHGHNSNTYQLNAIPLSDTYRTPKPPHGKGKHIRFGSFAATTPKTIKAKKFRPHGRSTIKIVDQVKGTVTVTISVERTRKSGDLLLCSGSKKAHPKPGRVVAVHLICSSGTVVVGGTASSRVPVKRGDNVTFDFVSRNGEVKSAAKIH